MSPSTDVLDAVVRVHVQEAGFLLDAWRGAMTDPVYDLVALREGPARRLAAHVDGLVIAGLPWLRAAWDGLLADLEDFDAETAAGLATGRVACGDTSFVEEGLHHADDDIADACAWALTALGSDALHDDATRWVTSSARAAQALQRRPRPGPWVFGALTHRDRDVRIAGLRAARHMPAVDVTRLLEAREREVRFEACLLSLKHGRAGAWRWALEESRFEDLPRLAAVADPRDLEMLLERIRATPTAEGVRAVGVAGATWMAPWLLELLDTALAPQAAESLAVMSGVDLVESELAAVTEEDDLVPDVEAIRAWWASLELPRRALAGAVWPRPSGGFLPLRAHAVVREGLFIRGRRDCGWWHHVAMAS
jgi:hypothetical protein